VKQTIASVISNLTHCYSLLAWS